MPGKQKPEALAAPGFFVCLPRGGILVAVLLVLAAQEVHAAPDLLQAGGLQALAFHHHLQAQLDDLAKQTGVLP